MPSDNHCVWHPVNISDRMIATSQAPKAYKQSRQAISAAFTAAAGLGGAAMSLLKLDIVRDFAQNVALFFSAIASKALQLARNTFGRVFGVISIDLNMVYDKINPFYIMVALGILTVILIITFIVLFCLTRKMNPDDIRQVRYQTGNQWREIQGTLFL